MADQGPSADMLGSVTFGGSTSDKVGAGTDKSVDLFGNQKGFAGQSVENLIPAPPPPPVVLSQVPIAPQRILPGQAITVVVGGISGPFVLGLEYPDGSSEIVWDGQEYMPFFIGFSSHSPASGPSQTFTVVRLGGWKQAPTFLVPIGGKLG